MPIYALVDCNNFFVSCERAFDPSLKDKPVAVLSNNDGCIVARSQEVKDMNVPMGVPYFQWRALCQKNDVKVMSSNYHLYSDMSKRVMKILADFCPELEVYSIDEAFLDLTAFAAHTNIREFCNKLRMAVLQWTGIPISIGVASTKTLAKLANHIAKKKTSSGVYIMPSPQDSSELLSHLPVEEIWGVGHRMGKRLREEYGVFTVKGLRDSDPHQIRRGFSVVGERIVYELRGISCLTLEEMDEPSKTIVASRSFGKAVTLRQELEESVAWHVTRAAERLRKQGAKAGGLYVMLRAGQIGKASYDSRYISLLPATFDTSTMIAKAKQAVREMYKEGVHYKKSGVCLYDIMPQSQTQGDMLLPEWEDTPKRVTVNRLVDDVNRIMGDDSLVYAATGTKRDWRMSCSLRSPRYTTHWNEILTV